MFKQPKSFNCEGFVLGYGEAGSNDVNIRHSDPAKKILINGIEPTGDAAHGNFVTTDTTQSVSGAKTFTASTFAATGAVTLGTSGAGGGAARNVTVSNDLTVSGAFVSSGAATIGGATDVQGSLEVGEDLTVVSTISSSSTISGQNVSAISTLSAPTITATGAISGASLAVTTVTATGAISGAAITGSTLTTTGAIIGGSTLATTGAITGASLTTTGAINSATLTTTGNATLSGSAIYMGTDGAGAGQKTFQIHGTEDNTAAGAKVHIGTGGTLPSEQTLGTAAAGDGTGQILALPDFDNGTDNCIAKWRRVPNVQGGSTGFWELIRGMTGVQESLPVDHDWTGDHSHTGSITLTGVTDTAGDGGHAMLEVDGTGKVFKRTAFGSNNLARLNHDHTFSGNMSHTGTNSFSNTMSFPSLTASSMLELNGSGQVVSTSGFSSGNLARINANHTISGDYTHSGKLIKSKGTAPVSASASGTEGEIRWDTVDVGGGSTSSYLYLCIATDTWTRVEMSSWQ